MKLTLIGSTVVLSGAMLSMTLSTPAFAAMQKPGKITCEEFIALDDVVKPKVVYWTEGFNKKGKPEDAMIDIDDTDKLVPVLVTECKMAPKESFIKTMKTIQDKKSNAIKPKPN